VRRRARCWPLLAALAVVAACQGSDPQPLEYVGIDRFGDQTSLVAGGGRAATIGESALAGTLPTLRLERLDSSDPDRTVFLGDVIFGGGGRITRLAVSDEAAAVVVGGAVQVVDLTDPTLPVAALPDLPAVSDLVVGGRWVLAALGSDLHLVDREGLLAATTFGAASPPTALLATAGGFLAFTEAGYVAVDPSGATPTFTEVSDPALGNLRRAFPDGAGALVAGPAAAFDRSRVLRLDLTTPGAPVIVASTELAGTYVAFAWDGGATSVVAVHGAADGPDPLAFHQGYVVREVAGGFHGTGVPLTSWAQSDQPLAARASHLVAVSAQGLLLLRIGPGSP
jgi:hypothetical protein